MEATVGRIVHFNQGGGQVAAAVVTRVHDPDAREPGKVRLDKGQVHLLVLPWDSPPYPAHRVTEGTEQGQWKWPPRVGVIGEPPRPGGDKDAEKPSATEK